MFQYESGKFLGCFDFLSSPKVSLWHEWQSAKCFTLAWFMRTGEKSEKREALHINQLHHNNYAIIKHSFFPLAKWTEWVRKKENEQKDDKKREKCENKQARAVCIIILKILVMPMMVQMLHVCFWSTVTLGLVKKSRGIMFIKVQWCQLYQSALELLIDWKVLINFL